MNICIIGGSGFIASFATQVLHDAGHKLTVLDLVEPRFAAPIDRFVKGDVCDPIAVADAIRGCDAVWHLAAAHHDYGVKDDHYFHVNEGGAKTLCAALTDAKINTVCFYSTVAVFGNAPEPRSETTPPQPISPYGKSKLAGEGVFRQWASEAAGRSCLIIRPTVTFGPRNFANMYSLIKQIKTKKFMPVGNGRNVKSLSYVENIVDATLYLWNLGGTPRFTPPFDIFHYIDKPDLSSRQIVDAVYQSLKRRPPGFNVPLPLAVMLGLPFDLVIALTGKNLPVSTARIKKLATQTKFEADKVLAAGFKPRFTLTQGIDKMVQWYMAEGRHQKPYGPVSGE